MWYNNYYKIMKENKTLYIILTASLLLAHPCFSQNGYDDILKVNKSDAAALKVLQNAVLNNPNSKSAKLTCAKVYMKNDRFKEAEELLMLVLEEDPTNKKANQLLIELNTKISNSKNNLKKVEPKKFTEPILYAEPSENANNSVFNQVIYNPAPKKDINDSIIKQKNYTSLPNTKDIINKAKLNNSKPDSLSDEQKSNNSNEKEVLSDDNKSSNLNSNESNKASNQNDTLVGNNNKKSKNKKVENITVDKQLVRRTDESTKNTIASDTSSNQKDTNSNSEKMTFKPFVAPQYQKKKDNDNESPKNQQIEKQKIPVTATNKNNQTSKRNTNVILSDTSKLKFLEATTDSFSINLEEAYARIEQNDLEAANFYLNRALALAANQRNTKKLYDVQLTRAVIFMYQCDFKNYGEHIFSIRKGLSDNVYKSLQKVYETALKLPNEDAQYKYVANMALKSGHYYTALDLAKKVSKQDKESKQIIEKSNIMINKINGELLLNNGSFVYALDYFENKNDEAEKGRTYLAISKSLLECNEPAQANIAEQFGKSCLINYIGNDQNNPKANLYLALYLLDKGDKNQAKEAIRRGLNAQGTNEIVTAKLLNLAENL